VLAELGPKFIVVCGGVVSGVGFKLTLSNQTMTAQAMAPAQMVGMNRLGRSLTSCIRLHPPRVFGSPAASTIRSPRLCASTSRLVCLYRSSKMQLFT
jgi:hypothetical protein